MTRFVLAVALVAALAAPAAAADLSITAANVKVVDQDSKVARVRYGETVTQGQVVYLKSSDRRYWKADADLSAEAAAASAVVLTPGAAGEYGYVVSEGNVVVGATLTVGEIYVVSGAAGAICPEADLSTGERVTVLGVATTSTVLWLKPFASSAAIP